MTAANARQAQTDYEEAKDAHQAYTEIEALLKQQILTALNQEYLSPLSHDTVGFLNVSTLDMLTHLENTYGAISADDLEKNFERLNAPWDPTTPSTNVANSPPPAEIQSPNPWLCANS